MIELPPFDDAARELSEILSSFGHPSEIAWGRKCDYYSISLDRHRVLWPLPSDVTSVHRGYAEARRRGLAALVALFHVREHSVAILESPEPDEIQGWNRGLKLQIRQPFVAADPIPPGPRWAWHQRSREYPTFQRL